jgi:hypothetical protein
VNVAAPMKWNRKFHSPLHARKSAGTKSIQCSARSWSFHSDSPKIVEVDPFPGAPSKSRKWKIHLRQFLN